MWIHNRNQLQPFVIYLEGKSVSKPNYTIVAFIYSNINNRVSCLVSFWLDLLVNTEHLILSTSISAVQI